MNTLMRPGLLAASLVLVGASLAGCGGDGAPADASEKEFCDSLNSLFTDLDLSKEPTQKEALQSIKAWGKDLAEVGTPEKIPDEARKGFELMIDQVAALDEDADTADLAELDADMTAGEKKASEAFEKYSTDTCGAPEMPELPEIPTSAP